MATTARSPTKATPPAGAGRADTSGVEVRGDDWAYLRTTTDSADADLGRSVGVVDLFCGVGGLSLGVREAARSVGRGFRSVFAVDADPAAAACYADNFASADVRTDDVLALFASKYDARTTARERELGRGSEAVEFLIGGPPCQGHSDLNNYSRRDDPKNGLYGVMARAARVLEPRHVLIENVNGAVHDRSRIVQRTIDRLDALGYAISAGSIDGTTLGIPQRRRRYFVVASRGEVPDLDAILARYVLPERDIRWAIGDLVDEPATDPVTTPSRPSADNRRRIAYLFEHDAYDLPNEQRPACHRDKPHTYNSVYGRLRWDRPAQTITSGFYSMCMGRYVHPARTRTLTAHEAARLQFFPDSFRFAAARNRTTLARLVGNAVPMKIGYVLARELLAANGSE